MKKKCLLIIAMLLTFVLSFAFVACGETTTPTDPTKPDTEQSQTGGEEGGQTGGETTPHTHEFTTYSLVEGQEPTETAAGKATSTCSCGETTTVDVAQLTDTTVWTLTTTPATCTENGVKSYSSVYGTVTVAIPAAHTLGELQTETDSTCAVHGHVAYYQCSACEKYFSDADAANELTAVEKPLLAHTLGELQAETDSTCIAHGHVAYYQCSVCEKYFSDADAANELATIEKAFAEHTYSAWTADAETGKHVRTCQVEGCTASESADHDYEGQTYTRNYGEGTHYIACKDCGYKNTSAHTFGDWVNYSSTEHKRSCTANGCYETEYGDHTGGTATCTDKAVCTACGTAYGNLTSHTFGSDGKCTNSKCTVTTSVVNKSYYRASLSNSGATASTISDAFTFGTNGIATSSPFTSSSASNVSVYVKDIDKATGKVAVVAEYDDKSSSGGWGDDDYYSYGSSSSSSTTRKTETYNGYIDANGFIMIAFSNGSAYSSYMLIPTDIAGDTKPTTDQFACAQFDSSSLYGIYFVSYTNGDNHFSAYIKANNGTIVPNATVTDFDGNTVAPASFSKAPAMVVKDGSGKLVVKYGYDSTSKSVIELDVWAGKYTNVDDETTTMTVSGTGNITMVISDNTYTGVYEAVSDNDDYNIIVKIKNSDNEVLAYYEVKADNTAYTFEYEIPNITLTYDLGDYGTNTTDTINKNTTYALKAAPEASDNTKIFSGWTIGDTTYKAGDKVVLSADTTITAVWDTKTKINVVDEKNVSRTIYAGSEDTLSTVLGTPTCDGEEFKCWTIDGNAIDDEATVGTTEFTVTAVWKNKYTLTVVYGNGLADATLNYFEGDVPAPVEPKYTNGKVFDHWYTSADNGTTETAEYTVDTKITSNTTIYVSWVEANILYGKYSGFEVYGASYTSPYYTAGKTVEIDTTGKATSGSRISDKTVSDYSNGFFKFGNYYGYYDEVSEILSYNDSTGTGAQYDVHILFKGATSAVTSKNDYFIITKYQKLIDVTVTKDGTTETFTIYFHDNKVEKVTWTADEGMTKVSDIYTYSSSYYSPSSIKATVLKIYDLKGNLIGDFAKDGSSMIEYDGSQGTYTLDGGESLVLTGTGKATIGTDEGTVTKSADGSAYDYDLYITQSGVKAYYELSIDKTAKTYSINKPMVTISFDLDGKGTIADVSVNKNIELDLSVAAYQPTCTGYKFKGWYDSKSVDGETITWGTSVTKITPTANAKLYAKWTAAYNITHNANPDNIAELTKTLDDVQIEEGNTIPYANRKDLDDTANYSFEYWYVLVNNSEVIVDSSYKPTSDVTLIAKWSAKVTLTIVYKDAKATMDPIKVGPKKEIDFTEIKAKQYTDENGTLYVVDKLYSDDAYATEFTDTSISTDTTIYISWKKASAMYGSYLGGNFDPSDSKDATYSGPYSLTGKFTIDVNGNSGADCTRAPSNDTIVWNEDGTLTAGTTSKYNGAYDSKYGIFYFDYQTAKTVPYHDIYVFFKTVGTTTIKSSTGSSWEKGCTELFTATYSDNSTLNVFIYNRHIYGGVTFVAKDAEGNAVTDISQVYSANEVYVLDDEGNWIAGFKKVDGSLTYDATVKPAEEA